MQRMLKEGENIEYKKVTDTVRKKSYLFLELDTKTIKKLYEVV